MIVIARIMLGIIAVAVAMRRGVIRRICRQIVMGVRSVIAMLNGIQRRRKGQRQHCNQQKHLAPVHPAPPYSTAR